MALSKISLSFSIVLVSLMAHIRIYVFNIYHFVVTAMFNSFTGYKYTFPFLSIDCGISVDDNYVQPLYKHCININRPTMALIGLPFYVCASQMFDLQVRFVMKFFSGKKPMPSKKEMLRDTEIEMQKRWDKGYKKRQAHMMGKDQV